MNNPHHLKHLARAFDSDAKARGLLEDIGYPMENAPPWTDPQSWWRAIIREIELGRIENGLFQLYDGTSRQYPGNTVLAEAAAAHAPFSAPSLGPASESAPAPDSEPASAPDLGPAFGTALEAVPEAPPRRGGEDEEIGGRVAAEVTRREDPEVRTDFREYRLQPYTLRELVVYGPDGDGFRLNGVPSTTLARDIAVAVLQSYDDEAVRDRRGRFVRIAIDLILPDGTARRLGDPDQTLHEAGVPAGARLQLVPEATAGARPAPFGQPVPGPERQAAHGPGRAGEHRTPHPTPGDQRMGHLGR